jgi:hypothetical protein
MFCSGRAARARGFTVLISSAARRVSEPVGERCRRFNHYHWDNLHAQYYSGTADSERHDAHIERRGEHLFARDQRRWKVVDERLRKRRWKNPHSHQLRH